MAELSINTNRGDGANIVSDSSKKDVSIIIRTLPDGSKIQVTQTRDRTTGQITETVGNKVMYQGSINAGTRAAVSRQKSYQEYKQQESVPDIPLALFSEKAKSKVISQYPDIVKTREQINVLSRLEAEREEIAAQAQTNLFLTNVMSNKGIDPLRRTQENIDISYNPKLPFKDYTIISRRDLIASDYDLTRTGKITMSSDVPSLELQKNNSGGIPFTSLFIPEESLKKGVASVLRFPEQKIEYAADIIYGSRLPFTIPNYFSNNSNVGLRVLGESFSNIPYTVPKVSSTVLDVSSFAWSPRSVAYGAYFAGDIYEKGFFRAISEEPTRAINTAFFFSSPIIKGLEVGLPKVSSFFKPSTYGLTSEPGIFDRLYPVVKPIVDKLPLYGYGAYVGYELYTRPSDTRNILTREIAPAFGMELLGRNAFSFGYNEFAKSLALSSPYSEYVPITRITPPGVITGTPFYELPLGGSTKFVTSDTRDIKSQINIWQEAQRFYGLPGEKDSLMTKFYKALGYTASPSGFSSEFTPFAGGSEVKSVLYTAPAASIHFLGLGKESQLYGGWFASGLNQPTILRSFGKDFVVTPKYFPKLSSEEFFRLYPGERFRPSYARIQSFVESGIPAGKQLVFGMKSEIEAGISGGYSQLDSRFFTIVPKRLGEGSFELLSRGDRYQFVRRVKSPTLFSPTSWIDSLRGYKPGQFRVFNFRGFGQGQYVPIRLGVPSGELSSGKLLSDRLFKGSKVVSGESYSYSGKSYLSGFSLVSKSLVSYPSYKSGSLGSGSSSKSLSSFSSSLGSGSSSKSLSSFSSSLGSGSSSKSLSSFSSSKSSISRSLSSSFSSLSRSFSSSFSSSSRPSVPSSPGSSISRLSYPSSSSFSSLIDYEPSESKPFSYVYKRKGQRKRRLKDLKFFVLPDLPAVSKTELQLYKRFGGGEATVPKSTKNILGKFNRALKGYSFGYVPTEEMRVHKLKVNKDWRL